MGCDIHIIVELKHYDKWVGMHTCESASQMSHNIFPTDMKYGDAPTKWMAFWKCESRNYTLFNALAGVRGEGSARPRGIPDDVSDLAQIIISRWGEDAHSHTYGTLRELGMHFLTHYAPEKVLGEDRTEWIYGFFGVPYDYNDGNGSEPLDRVRLIIFFDS